MSKIARRVVMSKEVASRWLLAQAQPEYRFRVFNPQGKDYPGLLRAFRDGKAKIAGVEMIPDLGIQEDMGSFYLWSSDAEKLRPLKDFLEKRGMETSWVW